MRGPFPVEVLEAVPAADQVRSWCEVRFRPVCGACRFWSGQVRTRRIVFERDADGVWRPSGREVDPSFPYGGPQPRCQRYAPELPSGHGNVDEGWSVTHTDDWCGEFEPRGKL